MYTERTTIAVVGVVSGTVAISFSGVFVDLAHLPASQSSFLRTLYAVPLLFIVVVVQMRRQRRPIRSAVHWGAVAVGVLEGLEVIAYHASIPPLGVGVATVLSNIQVVFVGVAGVVVFGERPRPWFWIALPITLGGIAIINTTGDSGRPGAGTGAAIGVVIAVLGAITYSAYLVALRYLRFRRPQLDTTTVMASVTLGTLIPAAVMAAIQGVARPAPTGIGNLWMLLLAVSTPVVGWWLLTRAIHHLPSSFTSVTLLLQPALALVWGVVLLHEDLVGSQIAGTLVVLGGIALAQHAVIKRRKTESPTVAEPTSAGAKKLRHRANGP